MIMCDQQTWRSRSFQFKFHNISASIWLVSRDTVPKQIMLSQLTMAASYSCRPTVLVSVGTVPSVSTPCAPIWVTAPQHQQRISGPTSETANAGSVHGLRDTDLEGRGQSGIRLSQNVKRLTLTLRVCVGLSDYRQQLQTVYGTGPVRGLRWYTRHSHTPTACMHNGLNYIQCLPAVPPCISRVLVILV